MKSGPPRCARHRRSRRRWAWAQALLAFVVAFSLSGASHAFEEIVENAVHVAETGHGAHDIEHPEGASPGTEHFCFGSVHHCGCCPTAMAAPQAGARVPLPGPAVTAVASHRPDAIRDGVRDRVDRPPQG